jgi:hypothetical protein
MDRRLNLIRFCSSHLPKMAPKSYSSSNPGAYPPLATFSPYLSDPLFFFHIAIGWSLKNFFSPFPSRTATSESRPRPLESRYESEMMSPWWTWTFFFLHPSKKKSFTKMFYQKILPKKSYQEMFLSLWPKSYEESDFASASVKVGSHRHQVIKTTITYR